VSGSGTGTTSTAVAVVAPESSVESSTSTTVIEGGDTTPTTIAPVIVTPTTDIQRNRLAIPGLGVMALGSALGALEITKRPRRGIPTGAEDAAEMGAGE
jgi:hypothetical protein